MKNKNFCKTFIITTDNWHTSMYEYSLHKFLDMCWLVGCSVGWSDFALCCNFWKLAHCCQSGIFLGVQLKKPASSVVHVHVVYVQQSFYFKKMTMILKTNIFWKLANRRYLPLTLISLALEKNLQLLFRTILLHDA